MDSDDNRQIIQFTSAGTPGAVKEIVLRASGTKVGEYLSVIKTEAPGAEQAMDSVTIELQVVDNTPEDDAEAESASNRKGDFNLAGIEMSTENLRLFIAGTVLVVVGLGIVVRVFKPKTRKQRKGAQQFISGGLFAEGMPPPPEPPSWQQESSWKY